MSRKAICAPARLLHRGTRVCISNLSLSEDLNVHETLLAGPGSWFTMLRLDLDNMLHLQGLIATLPNCFEWCFFPSLFRCQDSQPWSLCLCRSSGATKFCHKAGNLKLLLSASSSLPSCDGGDDATSNPSQPSPPAVSMSWCNTSQNLDMLVELTIKPRISQNLDMLVELTIKPHGCSGAKTPSPGPFAFAEVPAPPSSATKPATSSCC